MIKREWEGNYDRMEIKETISNNYNTKEWKLIQYILEKSISKNWKEAKREWICCSVYENETNCICGHPIKYCFDIVNKFNKIELTLGSECIHKIELTNLEIIEQGFNDKIINEWEYNFAKSLIGKKKLSDKQQTIINRINNKIFKFYTSGGI